MLPTCTGSSLKLYEISEFTRTLAKRLSCSELAAIVLEMGHKEQLSSIENVKSWLRPSFEGLLNSLNLGHASALAAEKWRSKHSFGNVVVYGDYDTDGISATVLAMEIFRHKALGVRYFIPRRDVQGYGVHSSILEQLARSGCNTLVVTDCGTNDSELFAELERKGIDVFVFDHHTVGVPVTFPALVNPCVDGDDLAKRLCATAVLWCWAWKESIMPEDWLHYAIDLAALATISDCMPLNPLNRAIVQRGLALMRKNPRRGLGALFEKLRIQQNSISEEQLSMRVIPCLNAPGRIACADIAVKVLLGVGDIFNNVSELVKTNKKRQTISEQIADNICGGYDEKDHVMFDDSWPVGVLSGVASRICSQRRSPVVLAAPVAGKIRGSLRVPSGANAVGILSSISDLLEAWGGHSCAAGFSVLRHNWDTVKSNLEVLLSNIEIEEEVVHAVELSPSLISLSDWKDVRDLGPFGNDNPCPYFYSPSNGNERIMPLGKDGRHSVVMIDDTRLLAFNAAACLQEKPEVKGWVYHPRIDNWRNEEQMQFVLDYAVLE